MILIDLVVRNHPGVMSHVAGLFSRRGFNLEAITCRKIGDGTRSRMRLYVNEAERLEQVVGQLRKLYDVLEVKTATRTARREIRLQWSRSMEGDKSLLDNQGRGD